MKLKKLLSIVLAFILCFTTFGTVGLTASAAVVFIETISEGETWRENWSSQDEYPVVKLAVEETGFYDFTFNDYKQDGLLAFVIFAETLESEVAEIWADEIMSSYVSERVFLMKDIEYSLMCGYFDLDGETPLDGDLSVVFNENTESVIQIPNCSLSSSNLRASFTDDDSSLWLKFKPTSDGDYSFNFENLHAYITVYNISSNAEVCYLDTEFYHTRFDEYWLREALIFNLTANEEYYIEINAYSNSTTKLSISKNAKTVKTIIPNDAIYGINSFTNSDYIDSSSFNYKLVYTDGSSEIMDSVNDISEMGYNPPYNIEYKGEKVWINDDYYLVAGNQPVEFTYNGVTSAIYVKVGSLVEYCSNLRATDEYDECNIEYENQERQHYFWRIKPSKSGYYAIWRYNTDDFDTNFSYHSITIVDDKNNVIQYDYDADGYPLVANKEYVLCFNYSYKPEYSYNDITFWLQKSYIDGWNAEGDEWKYYKDGNAIVSDWINDGGKWYHFDANGYMETEKWIKDSVGWVYLGKSGAMLTNSWCTDSQGWCYVGADGYAVTNCWKKDSIGWIWLNANGSMTKSDWVKDGGKWYYLDSNGYMVTNEWKKDSIGWVYLGKSGAMLTNSWCTDSQGWCYVGADGYAVTNCWRKDSIGWIWLNANGSMTKSQWVKDGGKWYYLNSSGYMVYNTTLNIGGKKYTFNSSGVWIG